MLSVGNFARLKSAASDEFGRLVLASIAGTQLPDVQTTGARGAARRGATKGAQTPAPRSWAVPIDPADGNAGWMRQPMKRRRPMLAIVVLVVRITSQDLPSAIGELERPDVIIGATIWWPMRTNIIPAVRHGRHLNLLCAGRMVLYTA